MSDELDLAYRDRISEAIVAAIMKVSTDENCLRRTGEIYDAMTSIIAMLLSTSEEASSPTKLRRSADDFAKKLICRVNEAKAAGKPPFEVLPEKTH